MLIVTFFCGFFSLRAQVTASSNDAIPATVIATYTQKTSDGMKVYKVENHAATPLTAFSFSATCTSKQHPYGQADAALSYAATLKNGEWEYIANVTADCDLKIMSAVFDNGKAYGDPAALMSFRRRRAFALAELKPIAALVQEQAASPAGINPELILLEIATHRAALPEFKIENEDEFWARRQVIDALDEETHRLRDRLYNPKEDKDFNLLEYKSYVSVWVDMLSTDKFFNRKPHIDRAR